MSTSVQTNTVYGSFAATSTAWATSATERLPSSNVIAHVSFSRLLAIASSGTTCRARRDLADAVLEDLPVSHVVKDEDDRPVL